MTNLSLNTGMRALLTARSVLSTIGHNISNANTRGYSRQRVDLAAAQSLPSRNLLIGGGVNALSIRRSVDQLVGRRLQSQISVSGGLEAQLQSFREIESILGEPDGNGLGGLMNEFFGRLSELSTAPGDSILRTGAVQSAVSLASQFNLLTNNLSRIGNDVEDQARLKVGQVNQLSGEIGELNGRIAETQSTGVMPNDLLDERGRKLEDLAQLVDITTIDGENGSVRVMVEGNLLIGASGSQNLELTRTSTGQLALQVEGTRGVIRPSNGELGGLIQLDEGLVDSLSTDLNQLARNMILEANRVHSTGMTGDEPFTQLLSESALVDVDGDGDVRGDLLSDAGLPFDVTTGALQVNVTDLNTGELVQHQLEISSTQTTVGQFVDELNEIPNVSAEIDPFGRVRILSSGGYGFDFANRLNSSPDPGGAFGGAKASLGSTGGPFDLSTSDALDIVVDPGGVAQPVAIIFDPNDFADPSAATADEVAAAINADTGAQAAGLRAVVQGDQVFLQTGATGTGASFQIAGGTPAISLGWSGLLGQTVTGSDDGAAVQVSGAYTGDANDSFTFRPVSDGTIGTTPGLKVDVIDASGQRVATLDVGENYVPGTELEVAAGVKVSFGLGELSATYNDAFVVELTSDSDTSDVLVALGLNSFFSGTGAGDIKVRDDIEADPSRMATSQTGSPGDSSLLLKWLDIERAPVDGLDGSTLGQFYGDVIGGVGFEVSSTASALSSNDLLLGSLEQRRDQVSGVNVDEELIDLVQFEQAFAAAAQFISVVNQINDEILNLL